MTKTEDNYSLPTSVILNGQALTVPEVLAVARHYAPVALGTDSLKRILAARAVIDKLADEEK